MPALYELDRELLEAYELASRMADETDGEIPRDFVAVIEAIEGDRDTKLIGYGKVLKSLEGLRDAIEAEADRLDRRAKSIDANVKRIKGAVMASMELAGETKKSVGPFRYTIANNSSPSLKVLDRDAIPVKYFKPAPLPEVDANAVKTAIKDGKTIEGVELVRGTHLKVS